MIQTSMERFINKIRNNLKIFIFLWFGQDHLELNIWGVPWSKSQNKVIFVPTLIDLNSELGKYQDNDKAAAGQYSWHIPKHKKLKKKRRQRRM